MHKKLIYLAGVVLCALSFPAYASEGILVQVPAVFAPGAPVAEAVKRECGVESLVGNHVFQKVSERVSGVGQFEHIEKAGSGKILKLTILSVQGVGGGGWTGPKAITLSASVLQNGQVLQSTVLRRQSSGGAFGGSSGTCPIMERIAVALGKDVANWLPGAMMASPAPALTTQSAPQPAQK
jgi:hypothetical protein